MDLAILLPTPDYFFQVNNVENISGVQFATGLLALASGVITAGTLAGAFLSLTRRHIEGGKPAKFDGVPMETPSKKEETHKGIGSKRASKKSLEPPKEEEKNLEDPVEEEGSSESEESEKQDPKEPEETVEQAI